jgi:putative membrane protein
MRELIRKNVGKTVAIVLAAILAIGSGVWYMGRSYADEESDSTQKQIENDVNNFLGSSDDGGSLKKEETTYAILDADGNQEKVYVNEWLKNGTSEKKIKDYSTLSDIENTSGDEKFTKDGYNITWDADGKDIKYQGTTDEKLPVTVDVSYYLNGKKLSAKQIAGKEGQVEIHFSYKVNSSSTTLGNKGAYDISEPYVMASGLLLDNDDFSNVTVSNGRYIQQGSNSYCVGIAFPGLNDDLNISKSKLNIPDTVVITADTTDFHIDGTYTVAMTGLFKDVNTSSINSVSDRVGELTDGLDELADSSAQLVKGSRTLSNGASELYKGTKQLNAVTTEIDKEVNKYYPSFQTAITNFAKSESELKSGVSKLQTGAKSLEEGLGKLSSNSAALNSASEKIQDAIFSSASDQLNEALGKTGSSKITLTPANYKQVIESIPASIISKAESTIRAQLEQTAKAKGMTLTTDQENAIMSLAYMNEGTNIKSMSDLQTALSNAASTAAKAAKASAYVSNKANQQAAAKIVKDQGKDPSSTEGQQLIQYYCICMGISGSQDPASFTETVKNDANDLVSAVGQYQKAADNASTNVQALSALAASISAGSDVSSQLKSVEDQLDQVVTYVNSVKLYTAGVDSAYAGSKQLSSGIDSAADEINGALKKFDATYKKYKKYIPKIDDYVDEYADGVSAVNKGAKKLASGSDELADGMYKFDREGIQQLVGSLDTSSLTGLSDRLKAVAEAGKTPVFVGGKDEDMDGSSKIIFKTAEIK